MKEVYDLLEKRVEALQRDYQGGTIMRDEYIAIKAELIAIFRRVDDLADKFQLTPVEDY